MRALPTLPQIAFTPRDHHLGRASDVPLAPSDYPAARNVLRAIWRRVLRLPPAATAAEEAELDATPFGALGGASLAGDGRTGTLACRAAAGGS